MNRETMIELGYLPKRPVSMEIKFFNENDFVTHVQKPANIRVTRKGSFSFNKEAMELLNLKIGSHVGIAQNQDDQSLYIHEGAKCFEIRKLGQANGFQSAGAVKKFFDDSAFKEVKSIQFTIQPSPLNYDGHKLYLIIIPRKILKPASHL